jgi:probable F420-dependent oxidoreductase
VPIAPTLSTSLPSFAAEPPERWDRLFEVARAADAAGIDRVWVSDHVVFGEHLEAYADPSRGGTEGVVLPTGPDGAWLEPLTVLSMVGAVTTDVRLATGILLAALRRPVVLAKTAATIDTLTGGRLDLGVGVGWQAEEYQAAGLDFARRGRLLDETLGICATLWRDQRASHHGELADFDAIHMVPKGARPGGPPIWISGTANDRVLDRLVRFGSGWIPWGASAADLVGSLPRVRAALADAGRDPDELAVAGVLRAVRRDDGSVDPDATVAPVPALVEAGVTDFRTTVPLPDRREGMVEAFVDLVAAFGAVTGRD